MNELGIQLAPYLYWRSEWLGLSLYISSSTHRPSTTIRQNGIPNSQRHWYSQPRSLLWHSQPATCSYIYQLPQAPDRNPIENLVKGHSQCMSKRINTDYFQGPNNRTSSHRRSLPRFRKFPGSYPRVRL